MKKKKGNSEVIIIRKRCSKRKDGKNSDNMDIKKVTEKSTNNLKFHERIVTKTLRTDSRKSVILYKRINKK